MCLRKFEMRQIEFYEKGRADLNRLRETVAGVTSELEDYRTEWNKAFEKADNLYRARLAELEVF